MQHSSHFSLIETSTIAPQQHFPGRSILGLLTSATSRTAMDMSLPLGLTMSSPLERLLPVPFLYPTFPMPFLPIQSNFAGQQAIHLAAKGQGSEADHR